MRARRIMAGFQRIGIVLALIAALPIGFGLWAWVTLGHPPPRHIYIYLLIALGAYLVAASIGWIIAGFSGEDDD